MKQGRKREENRHYPPPTSCRRQSSIGAVSANTNLCCWRNSVFFLLSSSCLLPQQVSSFAPTTAIRTTTSRPRSRFVPVEQKQSTTFDGSNSHGRGSGSGGTSTCRHMVLTTPESIFEQTATEKLLDDLIDESVRTSARRPIIMQFDPSSGRLWKQWKGTIFSETWDSCVSKMAYAMILLLLCKTFPRISNHLQGFNVLWGQLLQVTTVRMMRLFSMYHIVSLLRTRLSTKMGLGTTSFHFDFFL
jgi:hypothetical protein